MDLWTCTSWCFHACIFSAFQKQRTLIQQNSLGVHNCRHSGRLNKGNGTDSQAESNRETSSPLDWSLKDGCSFQHPTTVQQVKGQAWGVCGASVLRVE